MILGDIIHEFQIENHLAVNTPVILYLYELQKLKPMSDGISNRGGWQKNHLENHPELSQLSKLIFAEFQQFVIDELGPVEELSIYLGNMFCNINPPKSYHLPHIHDCHWTGVYYLQAPPDSGDLCIMKPHQGPSQAEMTKYFANVRLEEKIKPKAGYGYFFPSHLAHYVEENGNPKEYRISLSFNIRVTQKETDDMQSN